MLQPFTCFKVFVIAVALIFVCQYDSYAQAIYPSTTHQKIPDTSVVRKRFGRAAFVFGLSELTPWSFDHFVANKDYTDLTRKSTAYNLNPGHAQFDNDPFTTNQFGHPYH